MFQRIAAKGLTPWLGLLVALLPAAAANTKAAKSPAASRTRVEKTVVRQSAVASRGKASPITVVKPKARKSIIAVKTLPFLPGPTIRVGSKKAAAAVKAKLPTGVDKLGKINVKPMTPRAKYTHGGTMGQDFNLTESPWDEIEPQLMPNSTRVVFSANRGKDNYPPPAPDPTDPEADPPFAQQEPSFLAGVNDYHLYYRGNLVRVGLDGEQFEPCGGSGDFLAFSAFLPADSDIYMPEITLQDGSTVTPDYHGFPVRTINTTEDGIAKIATGEDGTIAKTLQPEAFALQKITVVAEDGTSEDKYMPTFAPDASPAVYPLNNRFIVFVSLRGYDPANPETHFTSLWLWDTAKEPDADGYVTRLLKVPGKSILHPRFSPDGQYLAFDETDITYDTAQDVNFYVPDPVFDINVSKVALTTPFTSRVFLSEIQIGNPGEGVVRPQMGEPAQITQYTDEEGNEPRDMMPFFNDLNQIGFSSDRLDNDGNGLADAVQTDSTLSKFDIYFYPFPYDPECADESTPDSSAHRQTLGDLMKNEIEGDPESPLVHFDDSNELYGSAAPTDFSSNVLTILTPVLYYQADDADPTSTDPSNHGWDIWGTDRAGAINSQGDVLVGLPIVTPNQNLTEKELADLKLEHRAGLPGDYVNISVQVNPKFITYDDNTGAPNIQVYAVVKDADNRLYEKLFGQPVASGISTDTWHEVDVMPVKFCAPDFQAYEDKYGEPGSDPDAPQVGAVLTLTSVDAQPDPTKPVWFTGKWFTPTEVSDFLMDVIVRDAPTEFGLGVGRITDNIGGFSTAPFIPSSKALVVSDFMAGQKSMDDTTGVFSASGVRCESYILDHPASDTAFTTGSPDTQYSVYSPWPPYAMYPVFGPITEWQSPPTVSVDPATGRWIPGDDGIPNVNNPMYVGSPMGTDFDLWRVQCREPITYDDVKDNTGNVVIRGVLKNYIPYTHTQPGYPIPSVLRTQRVSDRAVFWVAPHTGNLNGNAGQNSTVVGTIANLTTQAELLTYVNKGGRLLLAGTDVAFVLAQNDPNFKNALLTRLKVGFQSDADRDEVYGFSDPPNRSVLSAVNGSNQNGLNPIPYAMVSGHWDYNPSGPNLVHPAYITTDDGSLSNYHIDGITALDQNVIGGGEPVWWYAKSDRGDNSILAAVSTHTPTSLVNNTSVTKTLYFAFNPDALSRQYIGPVGNPPYMVCQNVPMQVFHNAVDFFTTGGFQGQVFVTNNVASPKDVLVYAVDDYNAEAFGQVRATALTDDNGLYYMDGLDSSMYFLYAYKTGFSMQHLVFSMIDGMGDGMTTENITLVPTQPASFSGTVYEKDTSPRKPIMGVPVSIRDAQGVVNLSTTSDANGRYGFVNVPTGIYMVTTPEGAYTLIVDAADPTKNEIHDYSAFNNSATPLTLKSGLNVAYDIALTRRAVPPNPATLVVTVSDATTGTALPAGGAEITVIDPDTGVAALTLDGGDNPCTTILSDPVSPDDGKCIFNLKAGQYTVRVKYQAYKQQVKTVLANPNDPDDPSKVTTVAFSFGGVLHTFPAGKVLMVSFPYDYSGTQASPLNFGNILGINTTTNPLTSSIVAYNALTQAWLFYPNYPADTGRIGRGYGFKLPVEGRITEQGTPVTTSTAVVRSETGWNLIGNPYPNMVLWNGTDSGSVKVTLRDDPAQKMMTIEDAKAKGYILSDLWGGSSTDVNGNSVYEGTYTVASPVASLQPWQAFWVKVAQPLLFYVPQPVEATATATASLAAITSHRPLMPNADIWGLNITASANSLTDDALALGISTRATSGIDAGMDLAKPSPMGGTQYLHTSFQKGSAGSYATDVRNSASVNTWTFAVNTTLNACPVAINWTPMGKLPTGYTASLVDIATGQRTNMSAANQYVFRSARNGGVRSFRVEVRRSATKR